MKAPKTSLEPRIERYLAGRPELAGATLDALSGDASTRRYFRLQVNPIITRNILCMAIGSST